MNLRLAHQANGQKHKPDHHAGRGQNGQTADDEFGDHGVFALRLEALLGSGRANG